MGTVPQWTYYFGPSCTFWGRGSANTCVYGLSPAGTSANTLPIAGVGAAGGLVTVGTSGAPPSAIGLLLGSSASASLPTLGGLLLIDPSVPSLWAIPLIADGTGVAQVSATVPAALAGFSIYMQTVFVDPAQSAGFALSGGLLMVL